MNFQMLKLDLEKAEEPGIKSSTSVGSSKKQENSRKNIYLCFIDYPKAFNCVDHKELWKILTAAAAKSLQSYPTLCNPIDGSPPGSPVSGILQARTLEWVAISFSNA